MMRWILILLLVIFSCSQLQAGNELDSLWQQVETHEDSTRILSLNRISKVLMNDSTTYAISVARDMLELSLEEEYLMGQVLAYEKIGIGQDILGFTDSAISYYDRALGILATHPEVAYDSVGLLINKGVAYYYAGDLGRALEYYLIAEQAAIQSGKEQHLPYLLNNLGVVYRLMEDYEDAIYVYERSLKIKTENNDLMGMANTEHNIGMAYMHQGIPDEAMGHLQRSKDLYLELGDSYQAATVDQSLGIGYFERGEYEKSRRLLKEFETSGEYDYSIPGMAEGNMTLAKLYLLDGNYPKALNLLESTRDALKNTSRQTAKKDLYFYLSEAYRKVNAPQKALAALDKHVELVSELKSLQRQRLQEEMGAKYAVREKSQQLMLRQLALEKSNRQRLFLILGLVAVLLIAGLLFWLVRSRNIANRELAQKNEQVQKALGEKEILLREIHHRVKNNLQVVSSLLSLQSRQIEDPRAQEVMKEGRNRVKSMALIHQNLYQDENLVGVDAADYIAKLTQSLLYSYKISDQDITIQSDVDPLTLDVDVIIPLGLILNELISNSLKYAFSDQKSGTIDIQLKQQADGIRLSVADNGKGIPEDFDMNNSKSLGMYLISSFAKKLNATFDLISRPGTAATIFIPTPTLS